MFVFFLSVETKFIVILLVIDSKTLTNKTFLAGLLNIGSEYQNMIFVFFFKNIFIYIYLRGEFSKHSKLPVSK